MSSPSEPKPSRMAMDPISALLRLSPELRNQIYEYALASPKAEDLANGESPLTRTCRQIREETLLMYYSCNDFRLAIPPTQAKAYAEDFQSRFASLLGRRQLCCMRHLEIEYHLSSHEDVPASNENRGHIARGGWVELAAVFAGCGLRKSQVTWRASSTGFSEPALGWNYFMWLSESARLNMYRDLITRKWKATADEEQARCLAKPIVDDMAVKCAPDGG